MRTELLLRHSERNYMVSKRQIDFFDQLLEEKDFGSADKTKLREEFASLPNKQSASAWIERAMGLPKMQDATDEVIQPTF